jgi:2-polyprenyl-6-methoxyphenol hydroxylase-like FAD-dependent oxidoreductase
MILALLLVENGIPVTVLEQHPDFDREFRGDLIGPSVLPVLEDLGLLAELETRGHARRGVERCMFVGARRRVTLPMGRELGALVSQPGLLALLHERCGKHAHYEMRFETTARHAEKKDGRVVAIGVRHHGKDDRITGKVFVACNGRSSRLRHEIGIALELAEKPDSTLWLRFDFSDAKKALPEALEVHMFGKGVVVVTFATTKNRLQIAYSAPGDMAALKKDLPALRAALLPRLPESVRAIVERKLEAEYESQLLRVSIDRMQRWHVPGLLFLGDAAHTMGPAGAQGLNLAIRDSIVAANHFIDAVKAGKPIDEDVFAAIEAERRPEIEMAQAGQLRAYRMVQKPVFVQHLMFTILSLVMRVKRFDFGPPETVSPKHLPGSAS